jgi:hypothetical protein
MKRLGDYSADNFLEVTVFIGEVCCRAVSQINKTGAAIL